MWSVSVFVANVLSVVRFFVVVYNWVCYLFEGSCWIDLLVFVCFLEFIVIFCDQFIKVRWLRVFFVFFLVVSERVWWLLVHNVNCSFLVYGYR